jgi:tyrosine decarboxylase/aspartate 1-decarboxylase
MTADRDDIPSPQSCEGITDSEARARMGVPPTPFPESGRPEADILSELRAKLATNRLPQKNWSTCNPQAHPFAKQVFAIPEAIDSYAVEFYRHMYPGIHEMGQEAVRMIGSLLGAPDPVGFITTGGTEANLMAIRLARNLGKKAHPEFIAPYSRHYSFDLAEELFNVKLRVIEVDETYSPKMGQVEDLINENTVALVCSTPYDFGGIDPVLEFSALARKYHLYLHVDAAVGGFLLPFMRRLGLEVPPFDFAVPEVTSMTVDPHKLGLCPRPSGAFILRDAALLEDAIPIDRVLIDTLTASGRPGSATAAVWAMIRHLGMEGYTKLVEHQIGVTRMLATGISKIEGLRLLTDPACNIICFTTDTDIRAIWRGMTDRGYVIGLNQLTPYETMYLRLFVHPLKETASAGGLLDDLADVVRRVRAG